MSDTPQFPELNPRDAELLSAYLDKMLSDDETRQLETRLQRDPQLRNQLRTLRQTVTLLNNLPELKAPRDFTLTDEMLQRRRGSSHRPSRAANTDDNQAASQSNEHTEKRGNSGWQIWGGLAAVLSVVLVGVLLVVTDTTPGAPDSQQIAQAPTQQATITSTQAVAEEAFAPDAVRNDDTDDVDVIEGDSAAAEMGISATPGSLPTQTAPAAVDDVSAADADIAGDAVELQSQRSADERSSEDDTAAEAESAESFSGIVPESRTIRTPPGADGARFLYTPTPFVMQEAAELQNLADDMTPAAALSMAEHLTETPVEAPVAVGGAVETGLAVPETAPLLQPGMDSQVLRVIWLVLDALRVLLSWSGCPVC